MQKMKHWKSKSRKVSPFPKLNQDVETLLNPNIWSDLDTQTGLNYKMKTNRCGQVRFKAPVGLTSWQSSRELTSWAFWQDRIEPARLSITHTADSSMKKVICHGRRGRDGGIEKKKPNIKMLLLANTDSVAACDSSCNTWSSVVPTVVDML